MGFSALLDEIVRVVKAYGLAAASRKHVEAWVLSLGLEPKEGI